MIVHICDHCQEARPGIVAFSIDGINYGEFCPACRDVVTAATKSLNEQYRSKAADLNKWYLDEFARAVGTVVVPKPPLSVISTTEAKQDKK